MLNKDISSLLTLTLMLSSGAAMADNNTWQQGVQTLMQGGQQIQQGAQNQGQVYQQNLQNQGQVYQQNLQQQQQNLNQNYQQQSPGWWIQYKHFWKGNKK